MSMSIHRYIYIELTNIFNNKKYIQVIYLTFNLVDF